MQRVSPSERTRQGKIQSIPLPVNQGSASWMPTKVVSPAVLKVVIDNGRLSMKFRHRKNRGDSKAAEPTQLRIAEPMVLESPPVIHESPPEAVPPQPTAIIELLSEVTVAENPPEKAAEPTQLRIAEPMVLESPPVIHEGTPEVVPQPTEAVELLSEIVEEQSVFQAPSQNAVRGIASLAVKQHYFRMRKTAWGKMIHVYCSGMVGPSKRGHEVERYVIEYLNRVVAGWQKEDRAKSLAEMKAGLARKAVLALDEIEDTLYDLIKTQSHPAKASPNQPGYKSVLITLGFRSKREIAVIFRITKKPVEDEKVRLSATKRKKKYTTTIEIVSVKSARDFRRNVGSRFSTKERNRRRQDEKVRRNRHESERWEFRRTA